MQYVIVVTLINHKMSSFLMRTFYITSLFQNIVSWAVIMKCITDVQMLRLSRVFPDSSCDACRTGPSGAWPRPPVEVTGSLLTLQVNAINDIEL